MSLKTRQFLLIAAAALMAVSAASCGASGSDADTTSTTTTTDAAPPSDPEAPEEPPSDGPGEEADFSDELPVSTTYGYVDFELTGAATASAVDDELAVAALEEGSQYAVFDVTISNPTTDAAFTVDPRTTRLVVDDEDYDAAATAAIEVEPEDSVETQFVYQVPDGTDLSEAQLVIQEAAGDPAEERIPATLSVDGTVDELAEPVELTVDKAEFTHETYCAGHGYTAIDKVVLSDRLGQTEAGGTLGVAGYAGTYRVGLGQARAGERFLTVYMNDSIVPDHPNCSSEIGAGAVRTEDAEGTAIEPVLTHRDGPGVHVWSQEPSFREAVFLVPEDQETFKLNFEEGDLNEGGPAVVVTATA